MERVEYLVIVGWCILYRDLIDLMDHSLNMEIGVYWYKKGTNNKLSYSLTDHLMVGL